MDHQELKNFTSNLNRADFIDTNSKKLASLDTSLPIGYGQTISQPSLVFEMSLLLDLNKDCNVLEIGTGSGYQTAILANFVKHVYTIELIAELSTKARERLNNMKYENITYFVGDGSLGVKQFAPYDRIIVTAGAKEIPGELIEQLNNNGIMIIPVGTPLFQTLKIVKKDEKGNVKIVSSMTVRFVEFKGKYGWEKE